MQYTIAFEMAVVAAGRRLVGFLCHALPMTGQTASRFLIVIGAQTREMARVAARRLHMPLAIARVMDKTDASMQ